MNAFSDPLFDTGSGNQVRELSTDPVRSNSQIYINMKAWVALNMQECRHADKHYQKLDVRTTLVDLINFICLIPNQSNC